jgi:hypothetical protein
MLVVGPAYQRPGRYLNGPPGPGLRPSRPGAVAAPASRPSRPASYPGVGPATSYAIERIVKSPYVNGPSGYA